MELNGNITPGATLEGSFDFDSGDYNNLKNKPSINGVTLEGNKTSSDLHIEGGGGGGGTSNYNDLENKPQINDITLSGNKSLDDLGIQEKINLPQDSSKYLDGEGNFTTPTSSSTFKDDILYESTAGGTGTINNVVLNGDLNNYNAIYCEFFFPAEGTYVSASSSYLIVIWKAPSDVFDLWWYTTYGNRWFRISSSDGVNATLYSGSWNDGYYPSIYRIHGVKV